MSGGIEAQVLQPYKYGFVTDIESETVPPGLSEDVIRLISEKKGEPPWMVEWRLKAYRNWQQMPEPHWANVRYGPVDYQAISFYAAPKQRPKLDSLDQVDPKLLETFEKLGIPIEERKRLAGGGGRRGVRLGLRRDHLPRGAQEARRDLLRHLGSDPPVSRPGAAVSRLRGPVQRQLLRGAQFRGVHGRVVRVRAQGRALPHGVVYLLPDQRGVDRPVRADADRGGRGESRELSGGLLRAGARREPAARGRGGAGGARPRDDQVFHDSELVSGR